MVAVLNLMPPGLEPLYFSKSERLRRRPDCRTGNAAALDTYLASQRDYYFHAATYKLCVFHWPRSGTQLQFFVRSAAQGTDLLTPLFSALDSQAMVYAYAGMDGEIDHRNGYLMRYTNTEGGFVHGWLGRDFHHHVPGLYWLNYFSREYTRKHSIDIADLAQRTGGTATELPNGHMLRLHDSPLEWDSRAEKIDDVIFETPGFFSKRRVTIPESVHTLEANRVIGEFGRQWP